MKRLMFLYCLVGLLLVACSGAAPEVLPTPLPTAVPPERPAAPGDWAVSFQRTFPPGYWPEGIHRYGYRLQCAPPISTLDDFSSEWQEFQVSGASQPQAGEDVVFLRLNGISLQPFSPTLAEPVIHPGQQTVAIIHLLGLTQEDAAQVASQCEVLIGWDEGALVSLTALEPFQP